MPDSNNPKTGEELMAMGDSERDDYFASLQGEAMTEQCLICVDHGMKLDPEGTRQIVEDAVQRNQAEEKLSQEVSR